MTNLDIEINGYSLNRIESRISDLMEMAELQSKELDYQGGRAAAFYSCLRYFKQLSYTYAGTYRDFVEFAEKSIELCDSGSEFDMGRKIAYHEFIKAVFDIARMA